jgi:hypothetical protein
MHWSVARLLFEHPYLGQVKALVRLARARRLMILSFTINLFSQKTWAYQILISDVVFRKYPRKPIQAQMLVNAC